MKVHPWYTYTCWILLEDWSISASVGADKWNLNMTQPNVIDTISSYNIWTMLTIAYEGGFHRSSDCFLQKWQALKIWRWRILPPSILLPGFSFMITDSQIKSEGLLLCIFSWALALKVTQCKDTQRMWISFTIEGSSTVRTSFPASSCRTLMDGVSKRACLACNSVPRRGAGSTLPGRWNPLSTCQPSGIWYKSMPCGDANILSLYCLSCKLYVHILAISPWNGTGIREGAHRPGVLWTLPW